MISSVTCLVNGNSFDNNFQLIEKFECIGLHLNLTEGKPLTKNSTL